MNSFYKTVNTIFSPFLVAPVTIFLVCIKTNSFLQALILTILITFILVAPTFITALIALKLKKITNLHIKEQKQRMPFFVVAIISVLITLLLTFYLNLSLFLYKTILSVLITLISCFIINKFTNISLHTAAITGAVTALFLIYDNYFILTAFIIPCLVGYSRIKTKNHTLKQVILGGVVACFITNAVFIIK